MKKVKLYLIVAAIFLIAIAASLLLVIDNEDFKLLEELGEGGWTIHAYAGLVLFIFFVLLIVISQLKKRIPAFQAILVQY